MTHTPGARIMGVRFTQFLVPLTVPKLSPNSPLTTLNNRTENRVYHPPPNIANHHTYASFSFVPPRASYDHHGTLGCFGGIPKVLWGVLRVFCECSGDVLGLFQGCSVDVLGVFNQQTANKRPTNDQQTTPTHPAPAASVPSRVWGLFVGRLWSFVGRLLVEHPQNTHGTPLEYPKQPQTNPKQPPHNRRKTTKQPQNSPNSQNKRDTAISSLTGGWRAGARARESTRV